MMLGADPQGMLRRQQIQGGKRPIIRLAEFCALNFKNSFVGFVLKNHGEFILSLV